MRAVLALWPTASEMNARRQPFSQSAKSSCLSPTYQASSSGVQAMGLGYPEVPVEENDRDPSTGRPYQGRACW